MFFKNDPWWKERKKNFWDGNIRHSQIEWEKVCQYRLDMIPQPSNSSKLLDIGAGSGLLTAHIRDKGYDVIGIEYYDKAINLAQNRGLNVLKINVEEDKFPFPDEHFDIVTCFEVIEHLKEPSNMLTEAYRVLKNDGYFIISTPNIAWWYLRLKLLFGIWGLIEPDHIRFFTPKSLKECLNSFGFKVVKHHSFFLFPRVCFFRLPFFHSISFSFVFACIKIKEESLS